MRPSPSVSVVVPMYNEERNVAPLVARVRGVMDSHAGDGGWELLLVDDGSGDGTREAAREQAREDERVRVVGLSRNYGQTVAMRAGFDESRGDVVVSMDGDLQNDPADIPRLLERLDEGYDLVTGWRKGRRESFLKRRLPSLVANSIMRWITGVEVHDNGCTLKAYRRTVLERLPMYSEFHRYIAPLAVSLTGARVAEVPVRHRARLHGESKYGLSRTWGVLADLVTLTVIRRFRDRPLMLFSALGLAAAGAGLCFAAPALVLQVVSVPDVYERSFVLPAASLLWLWLGVFLVLVGLAAEVALRRPGWGLETPIVTERSE